LWNSVEDLQPPDCIVSVESTIGSQSMTCDCHEHNIGPSSWPKIECDGIQNNISVLRPNGPDNYAFRFWFEGHS
jgi:hypothetical protein